MKKKIILLILTLSSLSLHAAQAPVDEPQEIFYQTTKDELKISLTPEGTPTHILDITITPISNDDEDDDGMTIKALMNAARKSRRPFCFILCTKLNEASAPAILLADENLHPLTPLPENLTHLGKFKLYPGTKGQYFSPHFIIHPAPPTVFIQPVPAPYPVFFDRFINRIVPVNRVITRVETRIVTIPYTAATATNAPTPAAALPVEPTIQPLLASPFNQERTEKLQEVLAIMQKKSPPVSTLNSAAPVALPLAELSSPISHEVTPSARTDIRVDRILHPQDADSADLLPLRAPVLFPSDHRAPNVAPLQRKQKNKKKMLIANTDPLTALTEANEDILEQEESSAALQAQERISHEKKEAELKILATQQTEKAAALKRIEEQAARAEALKRAKEEAKLRRAAQEKALQETQAIEKTKRLEQASRDQALEAAKKAATEKKAQEDQAQAALKKEHAKATSTQSAASAPAKKDKSQKAAADNDDMVLKKALKDAEKAAALLAQQPTATAMKRVSQADQASADDDATTTENAIQEKRDQAALQIITNLLKNANYPGALRLLPTIALRKPDHYWTFLTDIYTKAPHFLSQDEIANVLDNAKKLVKVKTTLRPLKCILYFGLALHADTYEEKETYIDLCFSCAEHLKAKTYWERIKLEHHDLLATAPCPRGKKDCPHMKALNFVTDQQSDARCNGLIFADAVVTFIKLYLGSCPQIRAFAPNRTMYIRNIYDKTVRQAKYTQAELHEIHSLIPEDIIPLDQRVQPVE